MFRLTSFEVLPENTWANDNLAPSPRRGSDPLESIYEQAKCSEFPPLGEGWGGALNSRLLLMRLLDEP